MHKILHTTYILHFLSTRLGYLIGSHPRATICLTILFTGIFAVGMVKFTKENRSEKLWNSKDSAAQEHRRWVKENFPSSAFVSAVLFESDDVLTPKAMLSVSM